MCLRQISERGGGAGEREGGVGRERGGERLGVGDGVRGEGVEWGGAGEEGGGWGGDVVIPLAHVLLCRRNHCVFHTRLYTVGGLLREHTQHV
jgi:hypothetical protein